VFGERCVGGEALLELCVRGLVEAAPGESVSRAAQVPHLIDGEVEGLDVRDELRRSMSVAV
jgi:hypothetical protein